MQNLNQLLKVLLEAQIDFVLIGGYAGVVHGSTQLTRDLDICANLADDDLDKLRACLKDYNPKHRMNPSLKPSFLDEPKNADNLNAVYLETDLGILDIIKSVTAVGDYNIIKQQAVEIKIFGYPCKVLSLDHLIKSKESLARDKDKLLLKELYSIKAQMT